MPSLAILKETTPPTPPTPPTPLENSTPSTTPDGFKTTDWNLRLLQYPTSDEIKIFNTFPNEKYNSMDEALEAKIILNKREVGDPEGLTKEEYTELNRLQKFLAAQLDSASQVERDKIANLSAYKFSQAGDTIIMDSNFPGQQCTVSIHKTKNTFSAEDHQQSFSCLASDTKMTSLAIKVNGFTQVVINGESKEFLEAAIRDSLAAGLKITNQEDILNQLNTARTADGLSELTIEDLKTVAIESNTNSGEACFNEFTLTVVDNSSENSSDAIKDTIEEAINTDITEDTTNILDIADKPGKFTCNTDKSLKTMLDNRFQEKRNFKKTDNLT